MGRSLGHSQSSQSMVPDFFFLIDNIHLKYPLIILNERKKFLAGQEIRLVMHVTSSAFILQCLSSASSLTEHVNTHDYL